MVTAYIFIITKTGSRSVVSAESFLKFEGVKDVTEVYGEYDLVVKVVVPSMSELQKFILEMRKIKGIEKTATMINIKD